MCHQTKPNVSWLFPLLFPEADNCSRSCQRSCLGKPPLPSWKTCYLLAASVPEEKTRRETQHKPWETLSSIESPAAYESQTRVHRQLGFRIMVSLVVAQWKNQYIQIQQNSFEKQMCSKHWHEADTYNRQVFCQWLLILYPMPFFHFCSLPMLAEKSVLSRFPSLSSPVDCGVL